MLKERHTDGQQKGGWREHGWRQHLIILLLYLLLTLLVTYPLPLRLNTHVIQAGGDGWAYDALQYVWNMWWTGEAVLHRGISPAHLDVIQFPAGVEHPFLLAADYVGFAGLPLTALLSPAGAYNLLVLLAFLLNAFTVYLFCLALTRHRWAAFLGGVVYAFLPNLMAHTIGGHVDLISTYWMPLFGLFLLRLLRQPTLKQALPAGVTLALALWVQPLYLIYFLAPLALAVLLHARFVERRPLLPALPAGALTLILAAALSLPFLLPLIRAGLGGNLARLQEGGATAFAADLLGFITPVPTNPILSRLGLIPPYAEQVIPTSFVLAEVAVYLGVVPLALAAWAVGRCGRRVWPWLALALGAAVLALGPLLKVKGDLVVWPVGQMETFVPLPHALLGLLPGLSLARTPGRVGLLAGFALAVLVAYALADLLPRLRPPWRAAAILILGGLILAEFLVAWPAPTVSLATPVYLEEMATGADGAAVLNLPMQRRRVNQIALYQQTVHEQPLVGGRVFRELPGALALATFLQDLHQPPAGADIIPRAKPATIAVVDRAVGVGHVFLHDAYIQDPGRVRNLHTAALGDPVSTEMDTTIYRVPAGEDTPDELVYALGDTWHGVEAWEGKPARWLPDRGALYVYAPQPQEGVLAFRALPLATPQPLAITVNGVPQSPLVIGNAMQYVTAPFPLWEGVNEIEFAPAGGCKPVAGDPRCHGVARAAGAECDRYLTWERCLSVLVQEMRVLPAGAAPRSLGAVLGERVRVTGYTLNQTQLPDALGVSVYWQTLAPLENDYTLFVHLLDENGTLIAQDDGQPLGGVYPTSQWRVGDTFLHRVTLQLPPDVPAGEVHLLAGMYIHPDFTRLPVAGDRPFAQDGLVWLQDITLTR